MSAAEQETYYINPTVYRGRPQNPSGRLPKELAVYDLLDSLQIPYERLDHDPLPTIRPARRWTGYSIWTSVKISSCATPRKPPSTS